MLLSGGDGRGGDRKCLLSMNGVAVYGWQALLVVKSCDEMYGMVLQDPCHPWEILPSVDRAYP